MVCRDPITTWTWYFNIRDGEQEHVAGDVFNGKRGDQWTYRQS
jgi:hypothetical protein